MDLSALLSEANLPGLVGSSIINIASTYVGLRLGLRKAIKEKNLETIREMIDKDNPNLSPIELARCNNIMKMAKLAHTYRKFSDDRAIEFSFEWLSINI